MRCLATCSTESGAGTVSQPEELGSSTRAESKKKEKLMACLSSAWTTRSWDRRIGHTICNLLSIIGKRYQDAGLRDLCIESGIIAEGSVSGVLEGKMYNRAVRIHKCVYEALMRLVWQQFSPWVASNHLDKLSKLRQVEDQVSEMVSSFSQEQYEQIVHSQAVVEVHELWSQFLQYLKSENGDLCAFWMSYIDVVGNVLLGLIRASREGNWQLHLYAIREMIPWCFAYDKVNYARYLPVYYAQMKSLQSDHREVYRKFMEGHFSVQLAEESPLDVSL